MSTTPRPERVEASRAAPLDAQSTGRAPNKLWSEEESR